jgi:hypothetical protein
MRALVFHGVGQSSWDTVTDPLIEKATDAIVRVDTTTICGSDLHILRGDVPDVKPGTVLGHEAVGEVMKLKGPGRGGRDDFLVIHTQRRPTMTENIAPNMYERLRLLESQVQVLAQAVRALAEGLEVIPSKDTVMEQQAARGARLAHELLLSKGL